MNLLLISEIREDLTPPNFGGEFAAHLARKRNPAARAASLTAWSLLAEGLGRLEGFAIEGESADACEVAGDGPGAMLESGAMPEPSVMLGIGAGQESAAEFGAGAMQEPGVGREATCPAADCFSHSPLPSQGARTGQAEGAGSHSAPRLPDVRFGESGKPEFVELPLHFSLAHSGALAAALLSNEPCGVDIERIRPEVAERMWKRCLSPEEQQLGLDFFECWTRKECIAKLTGTGLSSRPADLNTLSPRWSPHFLSQSLTDSSGHPYALSALYTGAGTLRVERSRALPGSTQGALPLKNPSQGT